MPHSPTIPTDELPPPESFAGGGSEADLDARINAVETRKLSGNISDPTLWRWVNDPKLNFPKPEFVNGRRYWRLGAVLAWWESRPTRAVPIDGVTQ